MKNDDGFMKLICSIFGENIYDKLINSDKKESLINELESILNSLDETNKTLISLEYGLYGKKEKQDNDKIRGIINIIKVPKQASNLKEIITKII